MHDVQEAFLMTFSISCIADTIGHHKAGRRVCMDSQSRGNHPLTSVSEISESRKTQHKPTRSSSTALHKHKSDTRDSRARVPPSTVPSRPRTPQRPRHPPNHLPTSRPSRSCAPPIQHSDLSLRARCRDGQNAHASSRLGVLPSRGLFDTVSRYSPTG